MAKAALVRTCIKRTVQHPARSSHAIYISFQAVSKHPVDGTGRGSSTCLLLLLLLLTWQGSIFLLKFNPDLFRSVEVSGIDS